MMQNLKESANYMWCVDEYNELGYGATGKVYRGVNKKTGQGVAVKVYKKDHMFNDQILARQQKEYDILKKLKHKNIVNVLAFENELFCPKKVLVTEFCNGGDLQTFIKQPQNQFGLNETEFLTVLEDLTSAVKYLRENNISHRDLKPKNILLHIAEDNRLCLKVADFDASKELQADESYTTANGTAPYMFPVVYAKGILGCDVKETFKPNYELWSIGVTLYETATGDRPFRPYKGKSSPEIMHYLMTEKKPRIISGVQHTEYGAPKWSDKLPDTCLLNENLKVLVTDLIAGLLENRKESVWSFEKFFDVVADIFKRKTFHIYYVNKTQEICLYMKPNQTIKDLKDEIAKQTKISTSNQMLLWENTWDLSQVCDSDNVSSFPCTSPEKPLVVLDVTNNNWTDLFVYEELHEVKEYADILTFFKATETHNPINYVNALKTVCILAHRIKRFIVKIVRCLLVLLEIPKMIKSSIVQKFKMLESKVLVLDQKKKDAEYSCKVLSKSVSVVQSFVSLWTNNNTFGDVLSKLTEMPKNADSLMRQAKIPYLKFRLDFTNLEGAILPKEIGNKWYPELSGSKLDGSEAKANTFVKKLEEAHGIYMDKVHKVEHEFLKLERLQNLQTIEKLYDLQKFCLETFRLTVGEIKNWYKEKQKIEVTIFEFAHLEKEFVSVNGEMENCFKFLSNLQYKVLRSAEKLIKSELNSHGLQLKDREEESHSATLTNGESSNGKFKEILSMIQEFQSDQSDMLKIADDYRFTICRLASLFDDGHQFK